MKQSGRIGSIKIYVSDENEVVMDKLTFSIFSQVISFFVPMVEDAALNTKEVLPTDKQQLKDAIALLRKCVQQPNYQDRFSNLHAEVVSFVQRASV